MKTVCVIARNSALKERLLVDLATIGYRVLVTDSESVDVIITDLSESGMISEGDLSKALLVVLESLNNERLSELMGTDDLLVYPYNIDELDFRIKLALIKRGNYEPKAIGNVLEIDGMTIDFDSYEVSIDAAPLDLTFKEYELLKCLITARGRVYTRDQLLSTVWGYDYYGGARTVDVHIRRLRAKLGRYESLIETVRNVGYRFRKQGL